MTFHFGHKILVTLLAFGLLMGTLIYLSIRTNFELVSKDYYQEELDYQEIINARQNAKDLSSTIVLQYQDHNLRVQLPSEMAGKKVSGELQFYCPADASRDRVLPLNPDHRGEQLIEIGSTIPPAAYKIRIKWNESGKSYFHEQYMNLNE